MSLIYQSRPDRRSRDSITFEAKDCVVRVDAWKFDACSAAEEGVGYPRAFPLTPEVPRFRGIRNSTLAAKTCRL